jgi:hypothetical protein
MAEARHFTIDAVAGTIRIGCELAIRAGESKSELARRLKPLGGRSERYGKGYDRLHLDGLSFGGQPALLNLGFHHGRLTEASWGVCLPGQTRGEWPTREQAEAEMEFVRGVLAQQIGFAPTAMSMAYSWGAVWSEYDPRSLTAGHGLRYTAGEVAKGCMPFAGWWSRKR